jgi:integrase/recombinase XerD
MIASEIEGDFTACDTGLLNRFFRDYHATHGQGGTNTKQRNLRHQFTWLEAEYDHPHPYTDDLNRYAPVKTRPSTLSLDFIRDLLAVTGGGKAKSFADVRDHALIRVLAEGLRRTEVVQMQMDDMPADLILQPVIRVVALKGAHADDQGRLVPLSHATARALSAYLRARRYTTTRPPHTSGWACRTTAR